jgi:hypothetical protein
VGDVEFKPRDLGSDRGYRVAPTTYRGHELIDSGARIEANGGSVGDGVGTVKAARDRRTPK